MTNLFLNSFRTIFHSIPYLKKFFSSTILSKSFILPKAKETSLSYFKDPATEVEYGRTYAKWNCSNKKCKNKWYSAYTWICFKFLKDNKNLYKNSKSNVRPPFSGSDLKLSDFFQQKCRRCNSETNKIIHYDNLLKSDLDTHNPHKSELCIKCSRGYPCQDY